MNPNIEKYYATNKFFLSRIGSWPFQRKVLRVLVPCLLTIVLCSVFVVEVICRIYLYYNYVS